MSTVSGRTHITIERRVAYALAIWPIDVASRKSVRALLPTGVARDVGAQQHHQKFVRDGSSGSLNRVSKKYQVALVWLEREEMIQRGEEFILIRDRRSLFDLAMEGLSSPSHPLFLALEKGAREIEAQLREERRPKVLAQREAELRFIRSLMVQPVTGDMRSGTKAVRFVPRPERL